MPIAVLEMRVLFALGFMKLCVVPTLLSFSRALWFDTRLAA